MSVQHSTAALGQPRASRQQPPPWSTPRRWSITTTGESVTTGYLPAWAQDDPSEADVPPHLLQARLAGINHRAFFEGQMMAIVTPGSNGEPEEEAVLEGSIDCFPYSDNPALRAPLVNIQICVGHWLLGLDPDGLKQVVGQLRAQADRLEQQLLPALVEAREDWSAHRPA